MMLKQPTNNYTSDDLQPREMTSQPGDLYSSERDGDKKPTMAYGDLISKVYATEPSSNTERFERNLDMKSHQSRKITTLSSKSHLANDTVIKISLNDEKQAQAFSANASVIELLNLKQDEGLSPGGINLPKFQSPENSNMGHYNDHNERARTHSQVSMVSNKSKNNHLQHSGYDGLKIPADWTKAEMHAKSRETKPELDGDSVDGVMQEVCDCCGYELSRQEVGIRLDVMELGFLGSGFPLFYNCIKYCCFMLLSLFIIQGIPDIIYNLQGNFCHSSQLEVFEANEEDKMHHNNDFTLPCPDTYLNRMSMANVIDQMKNQTSYGFHFSIAASLVQIALCIIFRRSQRMIESKVDEDNSTPSDYTIMVENIAQDLPHIETQLRLEFAKYGNIMKVNLVYDINDLEIVEKKIHAVIKRKQAALFACGMDLRHSTIKLIDEEIDKLEEEEHAAINSTKATKFVGTAFISFETEQQKQDAIDGNPQNSYKRFVHYFSQGISHKYNSSIYMDDRHLYISEAPEPNDVDWEFAHVDTNQKVKSRVKSFIEWALLSILSFLVILAISYYQQHKTEVLLEEEFELYIEQTVGGHSDHELEDKIASEKAFVSFLSYFMSVLIVVWNKFALPIIIHKICDYEKWSTKTNMNISFAQKLTLGLFFNTALITFFVEVILLHNVYAFAGGMIQNEINVFIMNAIIPSLAWIIDPWKIIQDWKRRNQRKDPTLTQDEANNIMEHPSYSQGKRYADIMKTMWFTFFYSPVMPIGTVISLAGLICYYFTDKYNLLFRRTVKESIGPKLSFKMVDLVEYSVIFHIFGQVFFKYNTSHYFDMANFVLLFCVLVMIFAAPMQKINEAIFTIETKNDDKKYQEVELTFDTDYDRENPITKKESIQKFQQMRNKISEKF